MTQEEGDPILSSFLQIKLHRAYNNLAQNHETSGQQYVDEGVVQTAEFLLKQAFLQGRTEFVFGLCGTDTIREAILDPSGFCAD